MRKQTRLLEVSLQMEIFNLFSCRVIIKKGRQCKAEREWYTPYQCEDPSPTIPTYRQKEEKRKKSRRLVGIEQLSYKEALALLLTPASHTPSNTGLARSFQRDTEKGIKVLLYCKVLQRGRA